MSITYMLSRAGPYIAHLESQYSWAQARTLPHSKGSRPTGMEAPRTYPRGNFIANLQSEDYKAYRPQSIVRDSNTRTQGEDYGVEPTATSNSYIH